MDGVEARGSQGPVRAAHADSQMKASAWACLPKLPLGSLELPLPDSPEPARHGNRVLPSRITPRTPAPTPVPDGVDYGLCELLGTLQAT